MKIPFILGVNAEQKIDGDVGVGDLVAFFPGTGTGTGEGGAGSTAGGTTGATAGGRGEGDFVG